MFISSILSLFGQNESCVTADPIARGLIVLMGNPSAYKQTIFIYPSDQILFMGIGIGIGIGGHDSVRWEIGRRLKGSRDSSSKK